MDKIKLSTNDIEFILNWRDEHKDLVRLGISPKHAVKIVCYETGYVITAIRDEEVLTFRITQRGNSLGKLVFKVLPFGQCMLTKNATKLGVEDGQSVLTVYMSAMALLIFGQETISNNEGGVKELSLPPIFDDREELHQKARKLNNKARQKGYTYILHKEGKEPRFSIRGSHNSPKGIFSVRGHYRHCKSGKVVWISEYMKGKGKKKSKTYKVKGKQKEDVK